MIARSSPGGVSGCSVRIGAGSFSRIPAATDTSVLPSNARLPPIISYNTAPRLKMSLRASASLPSTCSGAMYWNVPTIVPCWVSGVACELVIVAVSSADTGFTVLISFANPKSISLAPVLVSITLPGFRSRCTTPWR